MPRYRWLTTAALAPSLLALLSLTAAAAPPPKIETALGFTPLQPGVDYDTPTAAEKPSCVVEKEIRGKATGWVVRNGSGQLLRRFADSNADNLVDTWSYFKEGVEVYRDIDSDYDRNADQHRWFHSGGTRWGIDSDGDGKIDRWRQISAHEVAEEALLAIRTRDEDAFNRLLLTNEELKKSGLGASLAAQFRQSLTGAPSRFRDLLRTQKIITNDSRFVDFGAGRPGAVPAGADGATRDVVLYESASALVEGGGKPEQVQLGAMVKIGDAWRLVDAPQVGSDGVELSNVFTLSRYTSGGASSTGAPPTEKMQELMSELEKLDTRIATAPPNDRAKLVQSRARLLRQLATVTEDRQLREQWYSQLADMLSAAVVEGAYPEGARDLAALLKHVEKGGASETLKAHVQFQLIYSEWGLRSQDPKADYTKVQEAWLKQLKAFAARYPTSADTAEALLQLGMADEFSGKTEEAIKWYERLASEFASTSRGRKAAGAIRRLNAIGKPIKIEANAISGGKISLAGYRGKHVLIQYWATWCEPCKADMAQIKQLHSRYGGRGFAVLGVNLDSSSASARAFLKENRLPWKHAYDEGSLDGRLAEEMGVMTLPLMILVDDKGRVVRRNIHVAELDGELKRLLR